MDELHEHGERRIVAAVSVAVEDKMRDILMPIQFEHAAEIGILLRAAAQFKLSLACCQQDGRQIGCADLI